MSHDKNQWQAVLSLNGEPSGATSFTAQFVNGVNMATLKTITVDFETPESTPRSTTGSIKVTVQRAGNPRPGADVVLEDGKGGKVKEKTDNNGEFIFRKLTPGKYQVSSSDFNVQSDKESIEVTAGNVSATTLELKIK